MKKLYLSAISVLLLLISCVNNKKVEVILSKNDTIANEFISYTFNSKEVVHNQLEHYKTETIYIGTAIFDSSKYNVFTEFRKLQAANSIRGRSTLILIDKNTKYSICYDVEMPRNLPIDIYNNNFVFKKDSSFVFTEIDVKDVICLGEFECYQKTKYYK